MLTPPTRRDNSIDCSKKLQCINAVGSLKLTGNGTLTVTDNNNIHCGLRGNTNYVEDDNHHDITSEYNVTSQLALDSAKTTVIRSAMRDNHDGTYTWTYTVMTTP